MAFVDILTTGIKDLNGMDVFIKYTGYQKLNPFRDTQIGQLSFFQEPQLIFVLYSDLVCHVLLQHIYQIQEFLQLQHPRVLDCMEYQLDHNSNHGGCQFV